MKKLFVIFLGIIFNAFYSQDLTDTENYVYKKTYLSDPADPIQKLQESVQYLDGLGNPKQVILIKSTPQGRDLVFPVVYDQFGRKVKDYLPAPVQTSNAAFQSSVTESTINSYYGVSNAFSEKELELSPLSRLFESANPGEEWKMTSGHTTKYDYDANSEADKVKKYSVTTTWDNINQIYISGPSQINFYDENTLYKFNVKDEDNNEKIIFKDLYGHTVLIRKNDGSNNLDTYYVYDKYDHLTYVIPPLASAASSLTQTVLDNLCYQYHYDNKRRLVEKKLPGKGWEYMVYDKADQLILTQDANQRTSFSWMIYKYDAWGRPIYTGILTANNTRSGMQGQVSDLSVIESRNNTGHTSNDMNYYYSNMYWGLNTLLSVTYYDSYPQQYGFSPPFPSTILGEVVLTETPDAAGRSTKGLPVMSLVKNIEDDGWTKTYTYYDQKGRVIGTYSINHLGGYTQTESKLDFAGSIQKSVTRHKRLSTDTERVITENFTYDHQNRLLVHKHQVDSGPEEILTQNSYNELSQLETKKVGGTNVGSPLQTINYQYNIRGWMTKINDPANLNGKLFGYEVKYQNPEYTSKSTGRFNGNIAEIDWKTSSDGVFRRYNYQYDGLNRLLKGSYSEPLAGVPMNDSFNEEMTYDLNGNIKTLKRFTKPQAGTTPEKIDDLVYNYRNGGTSNILDQITLPPGVINNPSGYNALGGTFGYDANGNLDLHPDKGIEQKIIYNFLNLPISVKMGSGTFKQTSNFVYRADGIKLKKNYSYTQRDDSGIISITRTITDYLDGFQYILKSFGLNCIGCPAPVPELQFVPTSEGYFDYVKNKYIYNYADHLGNVRLSYAKNGTEIEVIEENNYYPFGLKHEGYNDLAGNPSYQYKYQGQELQETGWYSFKWRNYMPDLGRFFNIDPLSEVYAYQSHYNFSENRVIDAREIEGLEAEVINAKDSFVGGVYEGVNSSESVTSLMRDNSGGVIGANIQDVNLGTFKASSSQNSQNNFSWGDAGRIAIGFVPVAGNIPDIYEGARDGNWVQFGIGVGGLALDVATLGVGSILKGGIKAVGTELVEEGLELAAKDIAKDVGKLAGSGPVAGVLEVSDRVKSIAQFKNYSPKNGIEFVFDTKTNTFVVGKPKGPQSMLSPHESLAHSLEAGSVGNKKYVGGMFQRKGNTIFTSENSGHYGENWTGERRSQFIKYMENKTGLKVNHENWGH